MSWSSIASGQSTDMPDDLVAGSGRSIPEDAFIVIPPDTVVISTRSGADRSCFSTGSWSATEAPFSAIVVVWWWLVMISESGDEESNDRLTGEDEVGAEWSACWPVWVRSRSRQSFPVEYHHPSVDDCQTEDTNPPVWMVAMHPDVGNETANARIVCS